MYTPIVSELAKEEIREYNLVTVASKLRKFLGTKKMNDL